jgi:SnoaL-like protein
MVERAEFPRRTEHSMNDAARVRQAVERMLAGDVELMLALAAPDIRFQVANGGGTGLCREEIGRAGVSSYFSMLGEMVTFWQMDYTGGGEELIAWGNESFTVEPCGIDGGSDFALVFDLRDGLITRLLVVEDLPSFIWQAKSLERLSVDDKPEPRTTESWAPEAGGWEAEPRLGDLAISGEFPTH